MVKKSFAKIVGVAGTFMLIATGIFLYTHQTIALTSIRLHPDSSHSTANFQDLEECDKTTDEIGQTRLWGGIHFPVDDYEGLELGRKIGNWIVKKIQNEKCDN